jgi:hypothetical protein
MKQSYRISIVTSVIAALCIAPAAFAKPKGDPQDPANGGQPGQPGQQQQGKHGKKKGQAQPGVAQTAPGGPQPGIRGGVPSNGPVGTPVGPGVTQTRGPRGPGGVGIEIVRPPLPPPVAYYRRGYHPHPDYADSSVVSVQRALKARGYYGGPVDGDAGPGTRAAIRGFRVENGLGASSAIDGPLLHALRL